MELAQRRTLDRIFKPRAMALFGGIGSPGTFGYLQALSQIRYGYKGYLYLISAKGGEIAGHRVLDFTDEGDVIGTVNILYTRPHAIVERDGFRVGVIGLIGRDAMSVVLVVHRGRFVRTKESCQIGAVG